MREGFSAPRSGFRLRRPFSGGGLRRSTHRALRFGGNSFGRGFRLRLGFAGGLRHLARGRLRFFREARGGFLYRRFCRGPFLFDRRRGGGSAHDQSNCASDYRADRPGDNCADNRTGGASGGAMSGELLFSFGWFRSDIDRRSFGFDRGGGGNGFDFHKKFGMTKESSIYSSFPRGEVPHIQPRRP